MIVTLTPNPSLDKTVTVAELIPGGVNRIGGRTVEPAGKGVNINELIGPAEDPLSGHDAAWGIRAKLAKV